MWADGMLIPNLHKALLVVCYLTISNLMRQLITVIFCSVSFLCHSQDTTYLKVHFLYGSKPLRAYTSTEKKWFGGMLGGHVGIEGDSGEILNFLPSGKFHWFAKDKNRHSIYAVHSVEDFYAILGGNPDSVKKAIVYIPITAEQKKQFDSLSSEYLKQTPYDYALFGMRCGAASYEVLSKLSIMTHYSYGKTYTKIFYPKKLRKRLFRKASDNNWVIVRHDGSDKRKWERD